MTVSMTVKEAIKVVDYLLKKEDSTIGTMEKEAIKILLNTYEKEHKIYRKICPVCGKEFKAKRLDTVYCSQKCGNKQWNKDLQLNEEKLKRRREMCKINMQKSRMKKKGEK